MKFGSGEMTYAKSLLAHRDFVESHPEVAIFHAHRECIWFEGKPDAIASLIADAEHSGYQVERDATGMLCIGLGQAEIEYSRSEVKSGLQLVFA